MPGDYEDGSRFADSYDEYAPLNLGPAGRSYEPPPYGYSTSPLRGPSPADSYGTGAGPYDYSVLQKLRGMESPYYRDGSELRPTATAYARPSGEAAYPGDRSYVRGGEATATVTNMERFAPDFAGVFSGKPLSADSVFLLFVIIIALIIVLGVQSFCHRSERSELLRTVQDLRQASFARAAAAV